MWVSWLDTIEAHAADVLRWSLYVRAVFAVLAGAAFVLLFRACRRRA